MLKAAVCDDEKDQADQLRVWVEEWAERNRTGVLIRLFPDARSFRFAWEEEKDWWLVLLDIQMEGEDGVSLARALREKDKDVQIVFTTALSDYMEEGYEVDALHYLVKPIRKEKLFRCLDRALQKGRKAA